MTERKWKRGDRVIYTEKHVPSLTGKTGTVTGRDGRGWLRVRFDHQESYEKGVQVSDNSLAPHDGAPDAEAQALNAFIAELREARAYSLATWARDEGKLGRTVGELKAALRTAMAVVERP